MINKYSWAIIKSIITNMIDTFRNINPHQRGTTIKSTIKNMSDTIVDYNIP